MRRAIPVKRSAIVTALCLALLIIGYPAVTKVAEAAPMLTSASPNPAVVVPGGPEVILMLQGTGLEQIAQCAVVRNRQIVAGASVALGAPSPTARQVRVRANVGTLMGDAQLRIFYGRSYTDIPLNVFRVSVSPPANVAQRAPQTAQTMQAASTAGRAARPQPFTEIAIYPGARPVRTAAIGLPPAAISGLRAVRAGGGQARGIDLKLGQGPRGERFIDIITRADAAAGRYGMEFFTNGKWFGVQPGAFGLTIVPLQGSITPLGAMTGIIDTRTGHAPPTLPGPGTGLGIPGAQTGARDIGSQFGLTNPQDNPKGDLTRPSGVGDSRLMAGDTVTVTSSMTDYTSSDGTQHVKQTITTTDSKGNTMTDTMEATVDANGNSTESQKVEVKDKDGNVVASSTSTGSSTPDPEKAGCGSGPAGDQCRQMMQWAVQMLTPLMNRMHDFYMAKFTGLKGDSREGMGTSSRPMDGKSARESMPQPGSRVIDPNPEKGGSGESSPFGPITGNAPKKDLVGTLPDPGVGGEPGKTGPIIPPSADPNSPRTGRPGTTEGPAPTPVPLQKRY